MFLFHSKDKDKDKDVNEPSLPKSPSSSSGSSDGLSPVSLHRLAKMGTAERLWWRALTGALQAM
jgi:hypothetical protein